MMATHLLRIILDFFKHIRDLLQDKILMILLYLRFSEENIRMILFVAMFCQDNIQMCFINNLFLRDMYWKKFVRYFFHFENDTSE
jgi:hypothetical protein